MNKKNNLTVEIEGNVLTFSENLKYVGIDKTRDSIEFETENGDKVIITGDHHLDCSEYNYLNVEDVPDTMITHMNTNVWSFDFIDDYGIRLNNNGISCHSSQNGWYSTHMWIEVYINKKLVWKSQDFSAELKDY